MIALCSGSAGRAVTAVRNGGDWAKEVPVG
jgi:hypothetical protein